VKYRLRFFATHRALQQIEAAFFNKNNPSFGVKFFVEFTNHQVADSLFPSSHSIGLVLLEQALIYRGISPFLDYWFDRLTLTGLSFHDAPTLLSG
jgi:hypothetical protein